MWTTVNLEYKGHVPLRYPASKRAGSRAGLRPASELDSVMEFGLSCELVR